MRSIDTIRKHAATFHEETGKRPTRVYLGSAYWLGLCKELKALGIDASPLLLPPEGEWTHWAPYPTFAKDEKEGI